MCRLRFLLLQHRRLALFAAVLALAMKLLVPGGFMPERQGGTLVVLLCDGSSHADTHRALAITLPVTNKAGNPDGDNTHRDCPYAALALAGLPLIGVALMAAALAFMLLRGIAGVAVARGAAPARLRPPLRGPPGLV